MTKTYAKKTTRRPTVAKSAAGRTKTATSRPIYVPKDRTGQSMVPSSKVGGLVLSCESRLEAVVAMGLELDTRVLSYTSQPLVMDVISGAIASDRDSLAIVLGKEGMDRATLWFTDFELYTAPLRTRWLVEVKPKEKLDTVDAERIAQRKEACARLGICFAAVTEENFPDPLGANLGLLSRYRKLATTVRLQDEVTRVLQDRPGSTLRELEEAGVCSLAQLYSLIARGIVSAPLQEELLSPDTSITHQACPLLAVANFLNEETS